MTTSFKRKKKIDKIRRVKLSAESLRTNEAVEFFLSFFYQLSGMNRTLNGDGSSVYKGLFFFYTLKSLFLPCVDDVMTDCTAM